MVYFAKRSDGLIKIGSSKNPMKRLRDNRAWCPDARLFLQVSGERSREAELHSRVKASRMAGEWFYPTIEVLGLAAELVDRDGDLQGLGLTLDGAAFDPKYMLGTKERAEWVDRIERLALDV